MTLVEQTQERIKEMILSGEYDENSYLPSEGELSKQLNISMATTREAVRALAVRGFVSVVHGKGIVVKDNSEHVLTRTMMDMMSIKDKDLSEILELRRAIEPHAAFIAMSKITSEEIDSLNQLIHIMEVSSCKVEEYAEADFRFHMQIIESSCNSFFFAIVSACEQIIRKLITNSNDFEESLENHYHYHRNIFRALCDQNADQLFTAYNEHFTATEKNYVHLPLSDLAAR